MKILNDINVSEKTVFVRGDLDVPIKAGIVLDDWRLKNLVPTISYLKEKNCRLILAGHLGRPQENKNFELSTKTLIPVLSKILETNVVHFSDIFNSGAIKKALGYKNNQILLMENLRFWKEEEENDENFARKLASLADAFINEAFAASHRKHASIVGVPKFLPHAAGFHFAKEVEVLTKVLKNPGRPLVVIIGGAKIETKLPVITHLSNIADFVLVGGRLPLEMKNPKFSKGNVIIGKLTQDRKDLSPQSIKEFCQKIIKAGMIVWNGPMGRFESKGSESGTKEIAKTIAELPAFKIVGGGETILALKKFGLFSKMDWISQGGGAMLEFLAQGTLPGIEVLA